MDDMQSMKSEFGFVPEEDLALEKTEDLVLEKTEDLVLEKTRELTALLCRTEDYQRYQKSLKRLRERQDTYHKFNEFRRKNLSLDEQDEKYYELTDALYDEYKDILMEPVVMDFLTLEERVNMLLRRVYNCIAEEIQIDVSYMD